MRVVAGLVCSGRMTGRGIARAQGMDRTNHEQDRAEGKNDGEDARGHGSRSSSESLEEPGGAHEPHAAHDGERKHAQGAKHSRPRRCGDQDGSGQRPTWKERGAQTDEKRVAPKPPKRT